MIKMISRIKNCLLLSLAILSCEVKTQSRTFSRCFYTEPECPNSNVTFYLYTRDTQEQPTQLDISNPETIFNAKYIQNRPLIVLMHGYTGDKDYSPNKQIRPAYFSIGDFNIISVDYKAIAAEPCYHWSVANIPVVANCTAQLLDFLVDENIFKLKSIHLIGFSLGYFK
jgi:pimeloyl-ACP methyl ester carboxylesterase